MKAHQRIIRERKAEETPNDLFGAWWKDIDTDISKAIVREIDYRTAEKIILEYEWLGTMPAVVWHTYGVFWDQCCGGVVCYGPEYAENLGVWDKYGYTGKIIALTRGACVHWSPPNTASKLIQRSMDLLPSEYKVVTATCDIKAGEVGTIYQACNWICCKMDHHTKNGAVFNGITMPSRTVRMMFGSSDTDTIISNGGLPIIEMRKERYFYFRGSRKEIRQHRAAIAHLIKPYPKREEE